MRVLLHICCAPCACYPLKLLKNKGYEVIGLWYNPNIHPLTEYAKRLSAVRKLEKLESIKIIYFDSYSLKDWLRKVVFREEKPVRCQICYADRLEFTASIAKKGKFDAFTSTLFYSKFQSRELMVPIAETAAKKYGVQFLNVDFREGWKEGIDISKSYKLYRQQYCGCIYSEAERYLKKGKVEDSWIVEQVLKDCENLKGSVN